MACDNSPNISGSTYAWPKGITDTDAKSAECHSASAITTNAFKLPETSAIASISGINATFSTNPLQTTGRREPLIGELVIFEAGHGPLPRVPTLRAVADWLDLYLPLYAPSESIVEAE